LQQLTQHAINSTGSILTASTPDALVGDPRPAPLFNRTDFWAQGINFGLQISY